MRKFIDVINSLKGVVSEPVRCLIARRFASMLYDAISEESIKKQFLSSGLVNFLKACNVKDGNPIVPDNMDVEATELARFCDRWLAIQEFRPVGGKEWSPITAGMNSLRVTMVAELQEIAAAKINDNSPV